MMEYYTPTHPLARPGTLDALPSEIEISVFDVFVQFACEDVDDVDDVMYS